MSPRKVPLESAWMSLFSMNLQREQTVTGPSRGSPCALPVPSVSPRPRPRVTHRYCRCESPAKALSPISVNLLELRRLQRERGRGVSAGVGQGGHRGEPRDARPGARETYRNCREGMWAKAASRISVKAAFTIVLRERRSFRRGDGGSAALPPPCPPAPALCHLLPAGSAPEGSWEVAEGPPQPPCPVRGTRRGRCAGGWHPPRAAHALRQPLARGHAGTRVCKHTPAAVRTHAHRCEHTQPPHTPVPGSGEPPCPQGPSLRTPYPRPPAVSPRGYAPQGHSRVPSGLWSPRSRRGRAAALLCLALTDGCVCQRRRTQGQVPGCPQPPPSPRAPRTARTPPCHAFAPRCSAQGLSLPPQHSQQPPPALRSCGVTLSPALSPARLLTAR